MDEREVHELLRGAAENVQPSLDLPDRAERRYKARRARGRVLVSAVVIALIGSGIATAMAISGGHSSPNVARPNPVTSVDPDAFSSLAFVDATTGYGVETSRSDALLAKTADGGRTWHAVAKMPKGTTRVELTGKRAASNAVLLAWGDGVYVSTDEGAHWERTLAGAGVVAATPERIWASVSCAGFGPSSCRSRLAISDDSGRTWRDTTLVPPEGNGVTAIVAPALDTAYVVEMGVPRAIALTTDGGGSWQRRPLPCEAAWKLAVGGDARTLMLVCSDALRRNWRVYFSHDEAKTWSAGPPLPPSSPVYSVGAIGSSTFVVGLGGWTQGPLIGPLIDQWEVSTLPQPFGEVRAIDVVPGVGVFFASSASGVWFRSDDNSWERRSTPTPAISVPVDVSAIGSMTFIDANEGYGVESARYLVHTDDGGRTWRRAGLMPSGARNVMFAPVYAESLTHLVAWGDGSLSQSTDGGAHWKATLGPSVSAVSEASFRLWATVVCGAGAPSPCTPRLATSTDGGVTWSDPAASPELRAPGAQTITSPSGTSVYLVDGEFTYTHDGGQSWTHRPTPVECDSRPIPHIAVFVETLLLVCGPSPQLGNGLRAFVSSDEGRTWRATSLFPAVNIADSATVSATGNGLLAAAGSGPLRYTTDGGASWRDAFPMPVNGSIVALSQAYGVGVWAAAGDQGIWFSTDGAHWEQRASAEQSAVAGPPAVGFLSAPTGTDVHKLSVWGWTGDKIATLSTKRACCSVTSVSPDGSRVLTSGDGTAPPEVLDVHGKSLAQLDPIVGPVVWADDSRHVCELRPHEKSGPVFAGPADLVLIDPGHGERTVAQVPGYGPHTQPLFLRCSVVDDQVTVADQTLSRNGTITGIELSTGRTYTPKWVPGDRLAEVIAISGNGRYVLESSGTASGYRVVDTLTSAVVGHVDGQPMELSWDGHLVVELINGLDLAVVDWRTGAVLWRSGNQNGGPGGSGIVTAASVAARPESDDLALTVNDLPGRDPKTAQLWLVTPSTPPKLLANAVAAGII
jgi:photosystem II stability/assembly factor-like uncharacterized protein